MALSLLHRGRVIAFLGAARRTSEIRVTSARAIMTSRGRLEKVMEDLQKNPYFEKYAQKIATLQQTSPEEFLQRIEEKERKIKQEKVFLRRLRPSNKSRSPWSITSQFWRSNTTLRPSLARAYSQATSKNQYISTPIFYVNAAPHIGHLYTAVLADSIARFGQMQGKSCVLSTGTDEHGSKVLRAAGLLKVPVEQYCTDTSLKFRRMCDEFGIGYAGFVRTTQPEHRQAVQEFWKVLEAGGHIYKGKYAGWYCVSDEAFLSNQDLLEKTTATGESIKVSAESGQPVEWAEEENYKFKLSAFRDDLKHWLKDEKAVQPAVFHKILSQWLEEGTCLADLSVSRPTSRAPWGIPVPGNTEQTVYVWLDALVSYLTSLGYPDDRFRQFWPPSVQVIGKDILKFHGVYWPAFLIAAGLEPPRTLLCHSHWTVNDEKMSKSRGNVVSPFDAAEQFTAEGLRYFLLRESVPQNDANYSAQRALDVLNAELADTLGNLLSRCTGKLVNPGREIPSPAVYASSLNSEAAQRLRKSLESVGEVAQQHYEAYHVRFAVDAAMETLRAANGMVEHHKPWILRKQQDDENAVDELKAVIALALEATRIAALVLWPVVPGLSTHVLDFLSVPTNERYWTNTKPLYLGQTPPLKSEQFGHSNTIVFPKIKLAV